MDSSQRHETEPPLQFGPNQSFISNDVGLREVSKGFFKLTSIGKEESVFHGSEPTIVAAAFPIGIGQLECSPRLFDIVCESTRAELSKLLEGRESTKHKWASLSDKAALWQACELSIAAYVNLTLASYISNNQEELQSRIIFLTDFMIDDWHGVGEIARSVVTMWVQNKIMEAPDHKMRLDGVDRLAVELLKLSCPDATGKLASSKVVDLLIQTCFAPVGSVLKADRIVIAEIRKCLEARDVLFNIPILHFPAWFITSVLDCQTHDGLQTATIREVIASNPSEHNLRPGGKDFRKLISEASVVFSEEMVGSQEVFGKEEIDSLKALKESITSKKVQVPLAKCYEVFLKEKVLSNELTNMHLTVLKTTVQLLFKTRLQTAENFLTAESRILKDCLFNAIDLQLTVYTNDCTERLDELKRELNTILTTNSVDKGTILYTSLETMLSVCRTSPDDLNSVINKLMALRGQCAEVFYFQITGTKEVGEEDRETLGDILDLHLPRPEQRATWAEVFEKTPSVLQRAPDFFKVEKYGEQTNISLVEIGWISAKLADQKKQKNIERWEAARHILEHEGIVLKLKSIILSDDIATWHSLAAIHDSSLSGLPRVVRTFGMKWVTILRRLEPRSIYFRDTIELGRAKFSIAPKIRPSSMPLASIRKKKKALADTVKERMPEPSHRFIDLWYTEKENLPCRKTAMCKQSTAAIEVGETLCKQGIEILSPRRTIDKTVHKIENFGFGSSYGFLNTAEEIDTVLDIIDVSLDEPMLEEITTDTASDLLGSWAQKNNERSRYETKTDPIFQVPLPEPGSTSTNSTADPINVMKRMSFFNRMNSELPFPSAPFKGYGRGDLQIMRKLCKTWASRESMLLGMTFTIGKGGKLQQLREYSAFEKEERYVTKLFEHQKSNLRNPLSSEEFYKKVAGVRTRKDREKGEKLSKPENGDLAFLQDIYRQNITVCKPIWAMSSTDTMQELDEREEKHAEDPQQLKGEMIRPNKGQKRTYSDVVTKLCTISDGGPNENPYDKEVLDHFRKASKKTEMCVKLIETVLETISRLFSWEILIYYSKVGKAYMDAKAESISSGKLFIKKLPETADFLVINIKSTQIDSATHACMIKSRDRVLSSYLSDGVEKETAPHCFFLNDKLARLYEAAPHMLLSYCMLLIQYEGQINTDGTLKAGALTLCQETLAELVPFVLKNNKASSEMIQNYRYIVMTFLNSHAMPTELGKKLSTICRTVVQHRMMENMMVCTRAWGNFHTEYSAILEKYIALDQLEDLEFPSLLTTGKLQSIKSVILEMYICQLYNKDGGDRNRSTIQAFNKSLDAYMHNDDQKSEHWRQQLGADYDLVGEEFQKNIKTIMKVGAKDTAFSGKMVHDAGILLKQHLSTLNLPRDVLSLEDTISTFTGTTSVVSEPVLNVNMNNVRRARAKMSAIRALQVTCKKDAKSNKAGEIIKKIVDGYTEEMAIPVKAELLMLQERCNLESDRSETIEEILGANDGPLTASGLASLSKYAKWVTKLIRTCLAKLSDAEPTVEMQSYLKSLGDLRRARTQAQRFDAGFAKTIVDVLSSNLSKLVVTEKAKSRIVKFLKTANDLRLPMMEVNKYTRLGEKLKALKIKQRDDPNVNFGPEIRECSWELSDALKGHFQKYVVACIFSACLVGNHISDTNFELDEVEEEHMYSINTRNFFTTLDELCESPVSKCYPLALKFLAEIQKNTRAYDAFSRESWVKNDRKMTGISEAMLALYVTSSNSINQQTLYDTCQLIVYGRHNMVIREKNSSNKLYEFMSSKRSKVMLECAKQLLRLGGNGALDSTSVQRIAESELLSKEKDYYGIAPKEQVGGVRELGIQTFKTKVTNYVLEQIARSINRYISTPGLVESLSHVKAKYYRVDDAVNQITSEIMAELDGKKDTKSISANADNSKWGPCHSPSFGFSCMFAQLKPILGEMSEFVELKLLYNSAKLIEIPRPAVISIADVTIRKRKEDLKFTEQQKVVSDLLDASELTVPKVNDMIQGIPHHASSTYAMACILLSQELLENVAIALNLEIIASSCEGSDDALHVFTFKEKLRRVPTAWTLKQRERVLENSTLPLETRITVAMECFFRFLFLMNMKLSPKSTFGRVVTEFNQNFSCGKANCSPSVKFCSAQHLLQKCQDHVEVVESVYSMCQQAMFNAVPMVNILHLSLRHYSFYRAEAMFGLGGRNRLKNQLTLPFCLGGIWVPSLSDMIANDLAISELKMIGEADHDGGTLNTISNLLVKRPDNSSHFKLSKKPITHVRADAMSDELKNSKEVKDRLGRGVETAIGACLSLLQSQRRPLSIENDHERLRNMLSSEGIKISLMSLSPVQYLRFFKSLYRGHYLRLGQSEQYSFPQLIEALGELTPVNRELLNDLLVEAVVPLSEAHRQISHVEQLEISVVEETNSEDACWSEISTTLGGGPLKNSPADILLACLSGEDDEIVISSRVHPTDFKSDMALVEELCSEQLTKLRSVGSSRAAEDITLSTQLVKLMLSKISRKKGKEYIMFGPGKRSDAERVFLENAINRNTIGGLNLNLQLGGAGDLQLSRPLNYSLIKECISGLCKLVDHSLRNLVLVSFGQRILSGNEMTVTAWLQSEVNKRGITSKTKTLALTLLSALGNEAALKEFSRKNKSKSSGHHVTTGEGYCLHQSVRSVEVCRTYISATGSIHSTNSTDAQFIIDHVKKVNDDIQTMNNYTLLKEVIFILGDASDYKTNRLTHRQVQRTLGLNSVMLLSNDLRTISISAEEESVHEYSTQVFYDEKLMYCIPYSNLMNEEANADCTVTDTIIEVNISGIIESDYRDVLLASAKKVRLSFLASVEDGLVKKGRSSKETGEEIEQLIEYIDRQVPVKTTISRIGLPETIGIVALKEVLRILSDLKTHVTQEHIVVQHLSGSTEGLQLDEGSASSVITSLTDVSDVVSSSAISAIKPQVVASQKMDRISKTISNQKDIQEHISTVNETDLEKQMSYILYEEAKSTTIDLGNKKATMTELTNEPGMTTLIMSQMMASTLRSELREINWKQFFQSQGIHGLTMKTYPVRCLAFELKWPHLDPIVYTILSMSFINRKSASSTLCFIKLRSYLSLCLTSEARLETGTDGKTKSKKLVFTGSEFESEASEKSDEEVAEAVRAFDEWKDHFTDTSLTLNWADEAEEPSEEELDGNGSEDGLLEWMDEDQDGSIKSDSDEGSESDLSFSTPRVTSYSRHWINNRGKPLVKTDEQACKDLFQITLLLRQIDPQSMETKLTGIKGINLIHISPNMDFDELDYEEAVEMETFNVQLDLSSSECLRSDAAADRWFKLFKAKLIRIAPRPLYKKKIKSPTREHFTRDIIDYGTPVKDKLMNISFLDLSKLMRYLE